MVEIPDSEVVRLYASLMSEIKARLMEAHSVCRDKDPDKHNIIRSFEAERCYLQLRRSTELIGIAALLAHNLHPEFRAKDLVKAYHPDNLFKQLERLSDKSFPRAVLVDRSLHPKCFIIILDGPGAPTRQDIATIYSHSGDRLHAGALRSIVKQRNKTYDFDFIQRSLVTLAQLLNSHVIRLPDGRALLADLYLDDIPKRVSVEWMLPGHSMDPPEKTQS